MGRVLVVDDILINRKAIAQLLEKSGHTIDMARNGAEALARIKQNRPDLILLDQMMPEVDGLTFLAGIRRFPKYKEIPVIMLSGVTDRSCINKAEALGVKEYLPKGEYSAEQLMESIDKYLPHDQGQFQPVAPS
jgi:CheY-like chemotaxis protein